MSANEKIKPTHLQRCTYVYVRQSTAAQVQYNRESTDRQYKLAERALRLGWSQAQIKIIDEDLARSGSGTSERHGFSMIPQRWPWVTSALFSPSKSPEWPATMPIGIGCSICAASLIP